MRRAGIDARMLVYTKRSSEPNVACVGGRLPRGIRYCLERIDILWHGGFNKDNVFSVSTGRFAMNIHHHPWAKEADIICLHWINQGLLNLSGIRRLHEMGKKIVWTLHDMWPFTGVCHNSRVCEYYTDRCGNCMFLRGGGHPDDLSRIFWDKKLRLYDRVPITFVAESKHLELKARSSTLLRGKPVMTIHNPFHVDYFYTTPSGISTRCSPPPSPTSSSWGQATSTGPTRDSDTPSTHSTISSTTSPTLPARPPSTSSAT